MRTQDVFFALVRHALYGTPVSRDVLSALTPENLTRVRRLAAAHDLSHLVAHALAALGMLGTEPSSAKLRDALLLSVFRHERIAHEQKALCDLLEKESIPFIPLKGAVIRDLYPESWMRTSCDIDILVHEDDLARATNAIMADLGYTSDKRKNYHDISLYAKNGVHLELHFNILEDNPALDTVLKEAWDYATPVAAGSRHALSTEFLFFHVTSHMAYHFLGGGCGIRPLIDLYFMRERLSPDEAVLSRLLARAGIATFYRQALSLAEVWLADRPHTDLTREMEDYILKGGVYGTLENSVAVKKMKRGGRLRYLWYRVFPPYRSLKITYPVLKKHPYLIPVMYLRRWMRFLLHGDRDRVGAEIRISGMANEEKTEALRALLESLDLS